ncbi:hypothetical protein H310_04338 [Aphanomyces invadans]|uniref:Uncharacterized protein n=1 Tax=Aphanomyces invadans TaxID=157072 RepID=A0A024UCF7_9STRA|nr:hypothetical protein H310_04338 [Aphanomyces invadans]ETW03919.1 hypothetical protein H310_04338 [Aphanomyces invadans]|eukprot:XP_008866875.1 hypothetical protein H310_04338 [Aphanomyces invadans]
MTELQTCRYSHGKCKQPRATKKNGTMHTLCEFHRTKACAHQKKLDAKRRNEKLRLLETKKAMKHPGPDLHLWKEDENRMPMVGDKFKPPVWDAPHDSATLYTPNVSYGHHHHHLHHPSSSPHLAHHGLHHPPSQQHTPRDLYEYDDHQRYKFPSHTPTGSLLRAGGSPLGALRRDDSGAYRPQFPSRDGAYPLYSSPTSYSASYTTDSAPMLYDHKHGAATQRLHHHHVPHHMTTGEFDARYDYYDEAPSPYSRPAASAIPFGQYPPQPVYHQ